LKANTQSQVISTKQANSNRNNDGQTFGKNDQQAKVDFDQETNR